MLFIDALLNLRKASAQTALRCKPYLLLTSCMAVSMVATDLAINKYVAQKRNSEFKNNMVQLGLSIRDDLLTDNYTNLDDALLGFLRIKKISSLPYNLQLKQTGCLRSSAISGKEFSNNCL